MAYQRGSLKKVHRKEGETWVLRYRVTTVDGKRVEHATPIGLVQEFPKETDVWREVDRLCLPVRINENTLPGRIRFNFLAEYYLKADFGPDAVRPKSDDTAANMRHVVRDYLNPRWGRVVAEDIKAIEIQRWLKTLHIKSELAWPTVAKIRGIMSRIYKVGILHEHVTRNPVEHVQTRSKSNYRAIVITPSQTLAILRSFSDTLHHTLILTCSAPALRSSEILALRWADILWDEERIGVSKRWSGGKDGATKTEASDGYVPLHSLLATHLHVWHQRTPYGQNTDFVFPSLRAHGRVPLSASIFVAKHLRPAAKAAGSKVRPS